MLTERVVGWKKIVEVVGCVMKKFVPRNEIFFFLRRPDQTGQNISAYCTLFCQQNATLFLRHGSHWHNMQLHGNTRFIGRTHFGQQELEQGSRTIPRCTTFCHHQLLERQYLNTQRHTRWATICPALCSSSTQCSNTFSAIGHCPLAFRP
jgi:hypothetical protein